ncbi:MAG: hypothetical protein G01um101466_450 [Parcubacteria group bacterium Gr01-1014_66]|nr:MAG: hypothetical protein G01um101466_450 [Parcubacteria group bacterium Gr01-1014_66]
MKLLVVTQSADKNDTNLGAFYYWFRALASRIECLTILAHDAETSTIQAEEFALPHFSFARPAPLQKTRTLGHFWELFAREYALSDAVLFHQIPEYAVAAAPFLLARKKKRALWYAHKSITTSLRIAEKLVDHIFTSSPDGFRLPSKKVHFIGQAIHTDLFSPADYTAKEEMKKNCPFTIVSIGRIAPIKHYELMVRACALLARTWTREWTLSFIGAPILARDHEYLSALRRLIQDNGLAHKIHFKGTASYAEIPEILRASDLFLNTSRTGSLDKAVLEAMSTGLNVLTANEAYRTIVPERYFIERESPEFLAERIKLVADDPLPNLGLREIVMRDHGLHVTVDKIIQVLAS